MCQALSIAGQVDSDASPLHEVQTEAVFRQLPPETKILRQETWAAEASRLYLYDHE